MSKFKLILYSVILLFMFFGTANYINAIYQVKENNVFWDDILIEADPNTFEIITEAYGKDKNSVYYMNKVISGADPTTFKIIIYPYFRDNKNVYYFESLVEGADLETFKNIDLTFTKDKNYVFCKGKKIKGSNANTFKVLNWPYSKDNKSVYYECSILKEADPITFVVLNYDYAYNYAKDKNNVYYSGNIITGANADTFEVLEYGYAKDNQSLYLHGEKKKDLLIKNKIMYDRLKGKIILAIEKAGEAYYINTNRQTMFYLGRPNDAFQVLRDQGVGVTNSNLAKIPIGIDHLPDEDNDTDQDSLPNSIEIAIGTNPISKDTDNDGYDDKTELLNGYNPNGVDKIIFDNNFSNGQKGRILLQVESHGEAWYVNPSNGKRYFLGKPKDAFCVMKNLVLGISSNDFNNLQK